MNTYDTAVALLESEMLATIPTYRRVSKANSWLMKMLSVFVFFNRSFLTGYYTTVFDTVYTPTANPSAEELWTVLPHEWVHLLKAQGKHVKQGFLYLFPQSLTILALLSFLAIWGSPVWLVNLAWLGALAPLPAPFRRDEELDGYTMSMCLEFWRHGSIQDARFKSILQQFTSAGYYYMWPFKSDMERRITERAADVMAGKYDTIAPYSNVKAIVNKVW